MTGVIGILIIVIWIIFREVPEMVKNKEWREMYMFFPLLLQGTVLGIFLSLEIKVPNPQDMMTVIFKPLGDFILSLLE